MTARGTRWFVRTIWWVFANTASPRLGTVVIGLALARRMSPGEFAVFAVAVVALLGMQSLEHFGVGQAMAISRGDPYQIAPTVTTISVFSGAVICGISYVAAPFYARAMGEPAAASPIRWLAISMVISAVGVAPAAVLQRRSPRAIKVLIDSADNWTAVAVALGLAASGHALMGFAAGRIVGSTAGVLLSGVFAPRALRIGFQPRIAKAALQVGLPLAAARVLLFAANNADVIIVGYLLPGRDLGFYFLALCLASWPIALSTQPVRDSAATTFSKYGRSPQVGNSTFRSVIYLAGRLAAPICILIIISAKEIVVLGYGADWAPAAAVLAWLAPLAVLRICFELWLSYLSTRASVRATLTIQLVLLIALVAAVLAGVHRDGIVGAVVAQVVLCAPTGAVLLLPTPRRDSLQFRTLPARLGFRLAVLLAIGWAAFSIRRSSEPDGRLVLAVGSAISVGITALLIRRNRGVLHALRRSGARTRWSLAPDGLGPILTPVVDPTQYPALTLIPPPTRPRVPPQAGPQEIERLPERPSRTSTAEAGGGEQENLGGKIRSGALWSTLNTLVLRVANFTATVVLARTVFGPEAFGLYAVSQLIVSLLLSANEMGVSLAIVRWDGDVRTFARTVYTLAVASSTLLYCGLFPVAPELARLFGSPSATTMVRLMCLTVIIDGLACVPLALLTRAFAQRRMMLVTALNFTVTTGVTFWLAFAGQGPISFAWGSIAGCTTSLVAATIAAPFFVLPGWNTSQARRLIRFGLPLAGASLLLLGVYNVDSMVVGATLGPVALGLYALAFNISSWPARAITEAARRVSFAGFSRLADSAELLADGFARAIGLVMAVAVPACVLLATLAEPLIRFVYGQRWTPAAPVLTLLAVLGLLRVAYEISYDCLAAAGKRRALLVVQALWLTALCPALLIGAHLRGIVGVAAGHDLVAGLLVGPAFAWSLSHCGISIRSVLAMCVRPFLGGMLMIVFCEFALYMVGHDLAGAVLAAVAGVAVYLPIVHPMRTMLQRAPQDAVLLEEEHAA